MQDRHPPLPGAGEAGSLVDSALLLRHRAPELTLLLADRAKASAVDDPAAAVAADQLAVASLNRLGRGAEGIVRAVDAVRAAAQAPTLADGVVHRLHIELATAALELGEPGAAFVALRTVLGADPLGDDVRAAALLPAAEAMSCVGWTDSVAAVLAEASRHHRDGSNADLAVLGVAGVHVVAARCHRRAGSPRDAEREARAGLDLLEDLDDADLDGGQISGRLLLELVLALLDQGSGEAAQRVAKPVFDRPVRAAAAEPVGMMRLAVASRFHLPAGRHAPSLTLLADAVEGAQRHHLDSVLADSLDGLSYVHEVRGELADALHCVREARVAERRRRGQVDAARSALLALLLPDRRDAHSAATAVVRLVQAGRSATSTAPEPASVGPVAPAPADPGSDLRAVGAGPDVEAFRDAIAGAQRATTGPVGVVLLQLSPAPRRRGEHRPAQRVLADVSGRLGALVPRGSQLCPLGVDRIGVLLPDRSAADAARWVELAHAVTEDLPVRIQAGLAERPAGEPDRDLLLDAATLLRDTPGQSSEQRADAHPPVTTEPEPAGTGRRRRGDGAGLAVTDLVSPGSVGRRSGRRRAVDDATTPADQAPDDVAGNDDPAGDHNHAGNDNPVGTDNRTSDERRSTLRVVDGGDHGRRRRADPPESNAPRANAAVTGFVDPPASAVEHPAAHVADTAPTSDVTADTNTADASTGDTTTTDPATTDGAGPPPPPAPRPVGWSGTPDHDAGLGDLLAEALAAFQEGRRPHSTGQSVEPSPGGGSARRGASRRHKPDPVDPVSTASAAPPAAEPEAASTPDPTPWEPPAEPWDQLRDDSRWTPVWDWARDPSDGATEDRVPDGRDGATGTTEQASPDTGGNDDDRAAAEALTGFIPRYTADDPSDVTDDAERASRADESGREGHAALNGAGFAAGGNGHRSTVEPPWRVPESEWRSTLGDWER